MSTRTQEEIRESLLTILGGIKRRDVRAALEEDDNFMRALHLDSLDAVELTVRLGGEFGFEFGTEAEDLDALQGLGALTALVARRATA
ncbi:polyketide synthase [Streptomyces sp. NBRC 110611]|uniref:acyl carrier protein n=1 Tax=Streptomyces sp. NBRC 110611 TaxID=1621259 RepID=UPI0008298D80|nr:acyl carrier protein [Streptomyces sp. NBRC 110611]GAU67362.1 polyketide synthase [Streptomyces sp. NBRC 110611]